ncbi:hypothetical protein, partial [Vibrio cholerae]|uniref:hypothetical protein n=1 Tax=Vibrio cholerae TaxID=666 RepID=UPI001E56C025
RTMTSCQNCWLALFKKKLNQKLNMLDDHNVLDPPYASPNSEWKRNSVDGSVRSPHVLVEHRQAYNLV